MRVEYKYEHKYIQVHKEEGIQIQIYLGWPKKAIKNMITNICTSDCEYKYKYLSHTDPKLSYK